MITIINQESVEILITIFAIMLTYFFLTLIYIQFSRNKENKKILGYSKLVLNLLTEKNYEECGKLIKKLTKNDEGLTVILNLLTDCTSTKRDMLIKLVNTQNYKIIKKIDNKNIKSAILAIKVAGEYNINSASINILNRLMKDKNKNKNIYIDLQYHSLMAMAKLGYSVGFKNVFHDSTNGIYLTNRLLKEIISAYNGNKNKLYSTLINSNNNSIKAICIEKIGEEKIIELYHLIIVELASENMEIKIAAINALGSIGDKKYINFLKESINDNRWQIRSACVKTLGKINDPNTLELLEKSLNDKEWWVRYNSALSITRFKKINDLVERVKNSDDKFAKETLLFVLENNKTKIRKGVKNERNINKHNFVR